MQILENIDLKSYTTFRMGGVARYFISIQSVNDVTEAFQFAQSKNLPVIVLGGGSNVLISQSGEINAVILKIEITGINVIEENEQNVTVSIGAGENWDDVVAFAVKNNWWGIEALSWIPGTAGATPIQNVGAYGAEINDVLLSLKAVDRASGESKNFSNADCKFSYRDSVFKNTAKDKYIITEIVLKLSKLPGQIPDYPGVKKYFDDNGIDYVNSKPSIQQIRKAIIDIRNVKLPDPRQIASVGSFFKNAFVSKVHYEQLKEQYPDIVAFPSEDNYKISTGWMLENLGLKGKQFDKLKFYENNALVLTNLNNATFFELMKLVDEVKTLIENNFKITIEIEPVII